MISPQRCLVARDRLRRRHRRGVPYTATVRASTPTRAGLAAGLMLGQQVGAAAGFALGGPRACSPARWAGGIAAR